MKIMKLGVTTLGLSSVLALSVSQALAHHSRANFDLDTVVEYEGVVTRYAWTNPHTAMYIETKTPEGETITLEIEGNSIPTMRKRGWDRDSLKVGDRVVVRGNPDFNPKRHFLYFNEVVKSGTRVGGGFGNGQAPTIEATGSEDFTGVWRPIFSFGGGGGNGGGGGGRGILLSGPQPSNYPVTEKGAASYAKFSADDDPRNDCVPESLPAAISTAPYLWQIEKRANGDYEFVNENYAARRVIHMNQDAPPAGTQPDYDGYSVGRMENGELVIETTLFTPEPWGNDTGLDSSEQKHVIERYRLLEDGMKLEVTYTQTDPVYLTEPVTRTLSWEFQRQEKLLAEWKDCDPQAGSRHIAEEN